MKTHIYFFLALGLLSACNNNSTPQKASTELVTIAASADSSKAEALASQEGAIISFEKTEHDFGTITQGEKAEYSFKFTNKGKADLIIANAQASCGCTVPEYSKEPIQPGGQGIIKVVFNSDYRLDKFEKTITVTANTQPTETLLKISGFINPKPGAVDPNNTPIR